MYCDRRHYKRIVLALPFSLQVHRHVIVGTTRNISMDGVYVSVKEGDKGCLKNGDVGHCQFTLDDTLSTTFDCRIMRIYGQDIALQFLGISKAQEKLLRAILSSADRPPSPHLGVPRLPVSAERPELRK